MDYNTLGKTVLKVSKMGFGGASLGHEYGELHNRLGIRTVHAATSGGINFFDTCPRTKDADVD